MTKETGGPAFPQLGADGLSVRDYFAAKAMPSFIDYDLARSAFADPAVMVAKNAYLVADAMIAERDKDDN